MVDLSRINFNYSIVKIGDIWYRYQYNVPIYTSLIDPDKKIIQCNIKEPVCTYNLHKFKVIKVNPQSVWLEVYWFKNHKKIVYFNTKKQFASPTVELAKKSLEYRINSRLRHIEGDIIRTTCAKEQLQNIDKQTKSYDDVYQEIDYDDF